MQPHEGLHGGTHTKAVSAVAGKACAGVYACCAVNLLSGGCPSCCWCGVRSLHGTVIVHCADAACHCCCCCCCCCVPQEQKPIIWASQYDKYVAEKKAAKQQQQQRKK
jgi:hypothetical protein